MLERPCQVRLMPPWSMQAQSHRMWWVDYAYELTDFFPGFLPGIRWQGVARWHVLKVAVVRGSGLSSVVAGCFLLPRCPNCHRVDLT
jgi:hypothetical protein